MPSLFEFVAEIPPDCLPAVEEILAARGALEFNLLEDAIGGRAWLRGYFSDEFAGRRAWEETAAALAGLAELPDPVVRELDDASWRDSYKAHFRAWRFGPLSWVPVWERESYRAEPGEKIVWLDPGMAFGTGNHETTRLCCERLTAFWKGSVVSGEATLRLIGNDKSEISEGGRNKKDSRLCPHSSLPAPVPGPRTPLPASSVQRADTYRSPTVIDAGCGSGILALSAARLGFGRVSGFDNDPEAVVIARENAELNGLASAVEFFESDIEAGLTGRRADLVMANILANVLIAHARLLVEAVAPGGWLVLSGILAKELAAVEAAFAEVAPDSKMESRTMGDWADLLVMKRVSG